MRCSLLASFALLAAAPAVADDVILPSTTTASSTRWSWRGPPPTSGIVEVDITRGDVRVERSRNGRIEIEAFADMRAEGSPIALRLISDGHGLRVLDKYPAAMWRDECLPPDGEHGNFWGYIDRLRLIIRVPSTVRVNARVMAGVSRAAVQSSGAQ